MSAEMPTGPLSLGQPILLWLTDRSRYETGNQCPAERLLRYHWGPHGYGVQKAAQKVPLATGDVIHRGLGHILHYCQQNDTLPPLAVIDMSVSIALEAYQNIIDTRGLLYWGDTDEAYLRMIDEQRLLIEGEVRAWAVWRLPEVLRDWEICHVEEEHVTIVDCTCGLGDRLGGLQDHVGRGCEGIGIQTRADFVARHRTARDTYSYHEFKTVAENNARFRETYETTMQPYLGTIAIEDTLGIEVREIFIHGLIKGSLDNEYNPATKLYTGPEYQNSRLVYAYKDTAAVGLDVPWAVRFAWTDAQGVGHKLPKSFKRTPVSEFGPYQEYLETFAADLKPQVLHTIGPLPRKDYVRDTALEGWMHEERRIRWALHEAADLIDAAGGDWTADSVQKFLAREFRPTFDCQRFGGRYKCHYIPVCHKHAGWEDPQGLLGYVQRRPHHLPEEQQAVERGLLPPMVAVETGEE